MAIVQPLLQVSSKPDELTIESASQIFILAFGGLRSSPTLPGTVRHYTCLGGQCQGSPRHLHRHYVLVAVQVSGASGRTGAGQCR